MDLLENNYLDYVTFEALDSEWKGYITKWDQQLSDLVLIVDAEVVGPKPLGGYFRLRLEEEIFRDRYVLIHSALVDLGQQQTDWVSKSTPMETKVTFFLKKKRWGFWVWGIAFILYFIK